MMFSLFGNVARVEEDYKTPYRAKRNIKSFHNHRITTFSKKSSPKASFNIVLIFSVPILNVAVVTSNVAKVFQEMRFL